MSIKKIKVRLSLLFLVTCVGLFGKVPQISAAPLADTNDIFYVDRPAASSNLSGTSQVRFRLYDDDNANPEYNVGLFQSNCLTRFGTIASNDYSIRSSSNVFTKSWNTDGPILDRASIPNGRYCLKVCVTLSNNGTNYSVCDLRPITLTDPVNHPPVITTNPPNTLLLVGQTFGYDVNATDSDNDRLIYYLTTKPSFLQINENTGAISTIGKIQTSGSYSVVVRVSDNRGGVDTQQFTIRVETEAEPEISNIEILSPTKDSVFAGEDNLVKWNIQKIENIKDIYLTYSTDGSVWTDIATLGESSREYKWDVTQIKAEEYYLKITVKTTDGVSYEKISDKFSISSKDSGAKIVSSVSIVDVIPREDSEVIEFSEIAATIVPTTGAQVLEGKIKVVLDDKDISSQCKLESERIKCKIDNPVIGKHKVIIEVEDSKGEKASKQWFFDFVKETLEPVDKVEKDWKSSFSIIGLICLAVLLLLLIPWLIYNVWRKKSQEQGNVTSTTDYYYPDVAVNEPQTEPYSEPAFTESPSNYDVADDLDVGEGSLGAKDDFEAIDTGKEFSSKDLGQPTSDVKTTQFSEDDIPDWLKGESTTASEPVSPGGQTVDSNKQKSTEDDTKGAQPYSDYGLAPKVDEDE